MTEQKATFAHLTSGQRVNLTKGAKMNDSKTSTHIALIALFLLLAFGRHSPADLIDPDPVRLLEAQQMALDISGQLRPPADLTEQIYNDLAAIRSSYPEFADITYRPHAVPDEIIVGLTQEAAEQFRNGQFHALDELNELYGPVTVGPLRGSDRHPYIILKFEQLYNTELLSAIYARAEGVRYAEPNHIIGDRSTIDADPPFYTFILAWGDCPAGCIYREFYHFKVEDGRVTIPDERYVDAIDGYDGNYGLTPEKPFATIQAAIDVAVDGDIIIVQPGLYDEDIYFLGKNITLTSVSPSDLNTVRKTIIGRAYPDEALIVFHGTEDANCTLRGFEINGSIVGFDWLTDPEGENHTHATISHCILENNGGHSGNVIFGCDGLISNCVVAGNNNHSMLQIDVPAIDQCRGVIRNCTVVYNYSTGIGIESFGSPAQLAIENCVVYGNAQNLVPQVYVVADSTVDITYSNIYGGLDGVEIIGGTVDWGPGNIDADPCFVEEGYWQFNGIPTFFEGDYRLLENSLCIDAGDPNYIPEPNETDLDGNPRISGDAVDMGAYEYIHPLVAQVHISPKTLNLSSKGKWITCRISLPQDYDVADIDPNGIFLEDEVEADRMWVDEDQQVIMSKFSRSALQQILSDLQTPTTVELLVSGQLNDATTFEGTDTIGVIDRPRKGKSTRAVTSLKPKKLK
jgi:hypothetical protein